MTDADAAPTANLQVFIVEGELLPLQELEYDVRSAARLLTFSAWLGSSIFSEPDDDLLHFEVVDYLPIRRIEYGSPLVIEVQAALSFTSYIAVSAPTVLALLKRIGRLRVDFANASESNARRDLTYEQAETVRSERRARQYRDRLRLLRQAAEDLRRDAGEEQILMLDHIVRQAELYPERIQDSVDALFRLSEKTVRIDEVRSRRIGGGESVED